MRNTPKPIICHCRKNYKHLRRIFSGLFLLIVLFLSLTLNANTCVEFNKEHLCDFTVFHTCFQEGARDSLSFYDVDLMPCKNVLFILDCSASMNEEVRSKLKPCPKHHFFDNERKNAKALKELNEKNYQERLKRHAELVKKYNIEIQNTKVKTETYTQTTRCGRCSNCLAKPPPNSEEIIKGLDGNPDHKRSLWHQPKCRNPKKKIVTMEIPIRFPDTPRRYNYTYVTRFDVLKRELELMIEKSAEISNRTREQMNHDFGINSTLTINLAFCCFSDKATLYPKTGLTNTKQNTKVRDAFSFVRQMRTEDNTYLNSAITLLAPKIASLKIDTIVILTDGIPNDNKNEETRKLLQEIVSKNPKNPIKIHCIAIGHNSNFLRNIAEDNFYIRNVTSYKYIP